MHIKPDTLFAALAHPLRLRAMQLLASENELCVCELTHALAVAQPTISRHLALLREAGLVQDRRQGLWIYYRLNTQLPAWAQDAIRVVAAGIADDEPYARDRAELATMPNRPGARCCA